VVSEAQVSRPKFQTPTVTLQQTSPLEDVVLDKHCSCHEVAACIGISGALFRRSWDELESIVSDIPHKIVLENHFIAYHCSASAIVTERPEPEFVQLIVTHIDPVKIM
jgi:hypothetical protein